jgi:hypothetical protein
MIPLLMKRLQHEDEDEDEGENVRLAIVELIRELANHGK